MKGNVMLTAFANSRSSKSSDLAKSRRWQNGDRESQAVGRSIRRRRTFARMSAMNTGFVCPCGRKIMGQ